MATWNGPGNLDEPKRLRRKRTTSLVICVVAGLVFLVFVGGVSWSLATAYYDESNRGEFVAHIVTIGVSLLLAIWAGFRARRWARRLKSATASPEYTELTWLPPRLHDDATWLPPADDGVSGSDQLEAQISRLRTAASRLVIACGLSFVLLLLGAGVFVQLNATGQQLLNRGTRVPGTVTGVYQNARKSDSITVTYWVGDSKWVATIYRDSSRDYRQGDVVTVVYDPADLKQVRTLEERNDNQRVTWLAYALATLGCLGIVSFTISARGYKSRYRAVRATGWRPGLAQLVLQGNQLREITVEYGDDSTIALQPAFPIRNAFDAEDTTDMPVWVAGADQHMVVVVPYGRWGHDLRALLVKAKSARTPPSSSSANN